MTRAFTRITLPGLQSPDDRAGAFGGAAQSLVGEHRALQRPPPAPRAVTRSKTRKGAPEACREKCAASIWDTAVQTARLRILQHCSDQLLPLSSILAICWTQRAEPREAGKDRERDGDTRGARLHVCAQEVVRGEVGEREVVLHLPNDALPVERALSHSCRPLREDPPLRGPRAALRQEGVPAPALGLDLLPPCLCSGCSWTTRQLQCQRGWSERKIWLVTFVTEVSLRLAAPRTGGSPTQ